MSLPDGFIAHAARTEQLHQVHLDADGLADAARTLYASRPGPPAVAETMDSR